MIQNAKIVQVTPCGEDPSKITVKFCIPNAKIDFCKIESTKFFDEIKHSQKLGMAKAKIGNYEIMLFKNGTGMIRLLEDITPAKKILDKILEICTEERQPKKAGC